MWRKARQKPGNSGLGATAGTSRTKLCCLSVSTDTLGMRVTILGATGELCMQLLIFLPSEQRREKWSCWVSCRLEDFPVILSAGKQRLDTVQPDTNGAASGPQPEGSIAPRSPHGEKKEA